MPATTIAYFSGNKQRAAIEATLTSDLIVKVTDGLGVAVAGVSVLFALTASPQGSAGALIVDAVPVVTDVNGLAAVTFKLGDTIGRYNIEASSAGLTGSPVSFKATAVPVNAIVSLERVASYLKLDMTKVSDEIDDLLQEMINICSDAVEDHINGPVMVQDFVDQIYNGSGKTRLYLRKWPIVSLIDGVNGIKYRGFPTESWRVLEETIGFIYLKQSEPFAITLYSQSFPAGEENIKLSYKAGYSTVPKIIERTVIEMVAEMFKESNQGDTRLGRKSKATTGPQGSATDSYYELVERHRRNLNPFVKQLI